MTSNERTAGDYEDEFDFVALWRMAWDSKYIILSCSGFCALVALYLALTATWIYHAEAVVIEVRDSSMSGAASLANQLGGVASLAGVNLSMGGNANQQAQAVLQSRHLAEEFIQREGLLPELAANSTKRLTLWRAVKQFKEDVLKIREDKRTGLTTVAIEWRDPAIAAGWANRYVASANELLRARALDDSSRNIEYLNKQIANTDVVEIRRVMYNLIEAETKTLMLANARVEYAFTVVDPAVPPETRISPHRAFMVITGILMGALIGFTVAYVRRTREKSLRGSLASG
jgi:uncharacterized protein involved in exopolysaccharide biosynthesis